LIADNCCVLVVLILVLNKDVYEGFLSAPQNW
jgi:hypothetical protein